MVLRQNVNLWLICKYTSLREALPLNGSQVLLLGGRASDREAWPLTGRPCLSQGVLASNR